MVQNRDMNTKKMTPAQSRRSDAVANMQSALHHIDNADKAVWTAHDVLNFRSLGRTERWKSACEHAARSILDTWERDGQVTERQAVVAVRKGFKAMADAIV